MNTGKFQRLKQLHDNLHSRKGLLNVIADSHVNGCSSDEKLLSDHHLVTGNTQRAEGFGANDGELIDDPSEGRESASDETSGLLNAVKVIYIDKNVKLTPHKIFVGNISYKLTSSQLKTFFLSFGRVIHAQIIKDRVKKRSKGYGFVTFSKESEVEKVLQASEDELILDGRTLRVNRAEKKKRGRPIKETSDETDAKISIEEFIRQYNEEFEELKCSQTEISETALVTENEEYVHQHEGTNGNIVDITSLNDDILLHIFSFLDIKERVRIERVCHQWLQLSRQTWLAISHLDFKGVFKSFWRTGGLTDGILLSLFRRGCQNLKSLNLSHSSRLLTDYSLYLIGQNCTELQELNLSGVNVTMKSLKDLSSKCCRLKRIELQRCYEVGEKALWWLFKQCQNLEYINLGGNIRITGQCFFMLTDNCKTMILNDCIKLTDNGLQLLTERCPNLEELNISNCLYFTDKGISQLLKGCIRLRKLSFCKSPKDVSFQGLLELRNLNLLEKLELSRQNVVNDDILSVIGQHCPHLRSLDLEACHSVTDNGIRCLKNCLQLHKLVISYLDKVTDAGIELLSHNGILRELHARSCFNMTDKAVEQLVLHCPHLHELDVSGSERIRDTSLDYIEKYVGDNENMSLAIGATGITRERVLLTHQRYPSWSVTTQNLSDHHLRMDFDPYMDMGRILPEYDDEDEEEEEFGWSVGEHDAEYYLTADDPSMWEYEGEWMS